MELITVEQLLQPGILAIVVAAIVQYLLKPKIKDRYPDYKGGDKEGYRWAVNVTSVAVGVILAVLASFVTEPPTPTLQGWIGFVLAAILLGLAGGLAATGVYEVTHNGFTRRD